MLMVEWEASVMELFERIEDSSLQVFTELAKRHPALLTVCNRHSDFLIHHAVQKSKSGILGYLLGKGASPCQPGANGATPLHYAAARDDLCAIEMLLRDSATPNPINKNGMTPLHVAAGGGRLNAAKALLNHSALIEARDKYGRQPIHYAAGAGQLSILELITDRFPATREASDNFGQRPIHHAALFQKARAFTWLSEQGADSDRTDAYGRTPGLLARLSGYSRGTSAGQKAFDQTIVNSKSPAPLPETHAALCRNDLAGVDTLLREGADIDRADDLGRTLLHLAGLLSDRDAYDWLKEKGADTTLPDDYGWTPPKLLSYRLIGP
jgi:ankyrin repeat protein